MPLVDYEELRLFMALPAGQDEAVLGDMLSAATALFEGDCGRAECPFGKAQPGRVEVLEGIRGSRKLWLDYPIQVLTSVVTGLDVAAPTETLNPAAASSLVWRVGSRLITRTDGYVWRGWAPSWIKVTYDAQAYLPKDAKAAIMQLVAKIYREKGTGVVKSWTLGDESQTLETAVAESKEWASAVQNHSRGIIA